MNTDFALKKYLRPKKSNIVIGIIVLALAIFAASYGFAEDGVVGIICFGILLIVGIVFICMSISSMKEHSKEMKRLEEEGSYESMENDFLSAESYFDGSLRLSGKYIYPKHGCRVRTYDDIVKVYQFIQKKNGIENNRELRAVTSEGKVITLASLSLRGKSDDEVETAVGALLSKNPSIHVGYE